MNMKSVEDFDMSFNDLVPEENIKDVLRYNKNDVIATAKFFMITLGNTENPLYKGKNKLLLRQRIYENYGLQGFSYDDIKLGTELILRMYVNKINSKTDYYHSTSEWEIKKRKGTNRSMITGNACIPKWANFKDPIFKEVLEKFKKATFFDGITKGVLSFSAIYHQFKVDYGAGGAHGCIKPGVYDSDEEWILLDLDIASMYPNLAITLGIYPKHLGPEFLETYGDDIVGVRMKEKAKPKKEQDFVVIEGFKLAANGTYGKTKEKTSWLYDPLYPIKTTISGQILLSMWMERMVEASPDLIFIQVNTDGVTIKCRRSDKDKILKISDDLMDETGLAYEWATYDRMVVRDVNNYSAKYTGGDNIKHKGAFEIDKDLHKDPSMRIVPIALEKYFFEGVPIEETIKNHRNIFDFCLRLKTNKKSNPHFFWLDLKENKIYNKKLQRTNRYFISNRGGQLRKLFTKGTETILHKRYRVTLFNDYYEVDNWSDYDINYSFYINEANKIVDIIEHSKINPTLF